MKSARRNVGGDSFKIAVPSECNEPRDPSTLPRSAANKCQSKPDVFPRNSLKTNTRRSQQVTSFSDSTRIAVPSEQREPRDLIARISIRQYFQVEFAVTHSKQTIRVRATRQYFGGPSGPERNRREARHACSSQPRLMYICARQSDQDCRPACPDAGREREPRARDLLLFCAAARGQRGANDTIASTEFFTASPGPAAQFNSRRRRRAHA